MMWLLADTPPPGGAAVTFLSLLPWLLFIIVFYWMFVASPMRKKQKAFDTLMSTLKSGDKIVTNGGMYGVVTGISDRIVKIRVANNVVVEMDKSAIAGLATEETKEEKK